MQVRLSNHNYLKVPQSKYRKGPSLYQSHLAGHAARQAGQFSTDDLSGQLQGRPRQEVLHSGSSLGENREQQVRESPRAMEPDSSTEDPPTPKKDAPVEEEKLKVHNNKEEKTLPNYEKAEEMAVEMRDSSIGFSKKEERAAEYNKEDRGMPSFTFNKNEKILNFNKDAERGYNKMVSEAAGSSSVPPALKKKRFSNSLLEQFGDLVKEEHGGEFPLSVEINELEGWLSHLHTFTLTLSHFRFLTFTFSLSLSHFLTFTRFESGKRVPASCKTFPSLSRKQLSSQSEEARSKAETLQRDLVRARPEGNQYHKDQARGTGSKDQSQGDMILIY